MKKTVYILWSIILVIITFFLCRDYWHIASRKAICCSAIQAIDTLSKSHAAISLLTIVHDSCSPCSDLLNSNYYKQLDLPKFYMDKMANPDNKLLTQALYTSGFPTTYVMGPHLKILGCVSGIAYFEERLEQLLYNQETFPKLEIHHVNRDSVFPLISLSLKALHAYWQQDSTQMKKYAQASLTTGSYFFNHYMMYRIYQREHQTDSARLHKQQALKLNHHAREAYLYDNLIDTLQISMP